MRVPAHRNFHRFLQQVREHAGILPRTLQRLCWAQAGGQSLGSGQSWGLCLGGRPRGVLSPHGPLPGPWTSLILTGSFGCPPPFQAWDPASALGLVLGVFLSFPLSLECVHVQWQKPPDRRPRSHEPLAGSGNRLFKQLPTTGLELPDP